MSLESLRSKAAKVNVNPTEGQKRAGNYRKGHISIHGVSITIENPRGSVRSGASKDGAQWRATLPADYGYVKRTTGADRDHIDVYLGPDHGAKLVYIIDQKHHDTGKFDEHKCMMCFPGRAAALRAYRSAFSDGKDRVLNCTIMTIAQFKKWLRVPRTKPMPNHWSHAIPHD